MKKVLISIFLTSLSLNAQTATKDLEQNELYLERFLESKKIISEYLNIRDFSLDELDRIQDESISEEVSIAKQWLLYFYSKGISLDYLVEANEYFKNQRVYDVIDFNRRNMNENIEVDPNKIKVPKINFPDVDAQIEYINKFDNWKLALDNIETREEMDNFFGEYYTNYDKKYSVLQRISFKHRYSYSFPSTKTTGSVTYNSVSDNLSFEASTSDYDGGYNEVRSLYIQFNFAPKVNEYGRESYLLGTDRVESISLGNEMQDISNKQFNQIWSRKT